MYLVLECAKLIINKEIRKKHLIKQIVRFFSISFVLLLLICMKIRIFANYLCAFNK